MDENGFVNLYYGVSAPTPYKLRSIKYTKPTAEGVALVLFNTPDNLHALTLTQQWESFLCLEHAKRDDAVRAVVWSATGQRAFSSGASLKGSVDPDIPTEVQAAYRRQGLAPGPDFVLKNQTIAFWDFPKPLIFAINGLAVGGGANLALVNFGDMVIASQKARFMYPFAKLGLTPELGSSLMMPHLVGMTRAKEIMMRGKWVTAERALALGLVNEVVAPDELMQKAMEIAAELAAKNPETLRLMKMVMNQPLRTQLEAVLDVENMTLLKSIKSLKGPSILDAKPSATTASATKIPNSKL